MHKYKMYPMKMITSGAPVSKTIIQISSGDHPAMTKKRLEKAVEAEERTVEKGAFASAHVTQGDRAERKKRKEVCKTLSSSARTFQGNHRGGPANFKCVIVAPRLTQTMVTVDLRM